MIVLGIETSCDDTCAAVVSKKGMKSLSSVVSSQIETHKEWGGVYPTLAKREHQSNLVPVVKETLERAGLLKKEKGSLCKEAPLIMSREKELLPQTESFVSSYRPEVDAIAVTVGPGLDPCLWVGVNFARVLSCSYNIPIIPVNHIQAHILSFLLTNKKINFPAVALIASGGHTELVLMRSMGNFQCLGKTRDDAAGECFDKTARILGLPYPGGPEISKKAQEAEGKQKIKLPRPMINSGDYDFSFSGLKTAVLYDSQKRKGDYVADMAKEIEEAISDVLISKLKRAGEEYKAKTLILGGGVTANKRLREKAEQIRGVDVVIPPPSLSVDNAEMIAATAIAVGKKTDYKEVEVDCNLKIDFP